jgi:hypothetical protein
MLPRFGRGGDIGRHSDVFVCEQMSNRNLQR